MFHSDWQGSTQTHPHCVLEEATWWTHVSYLVVLSSHKDILEQGLLYVEENYWGCHFSRPHHSSLELQSRREGFQTYAGTGFLHSPGSQDYAGAWKKPSI